MGSSRGMRMENNKVDKDFEWCYWKLSYRRKFIRTLWVLAIVILMSPFLISKDRTATATVLIILTLVQLIYNYLKWQKDKIDL